MFGEDEATLEEIEEVEEEERKIVWRFPDYIEHRLWDLHNRYGPMFFIELNNYLRDNNLSANRSLDFDRIVYPLPTDDTHVPTPVVINSKWGFGSKVDLSLNFLPISVKGVNDFDFRYVFHNYQRGIQEEIKESFYKLLMYLEFKLHGQTILDEWF